MIDETRLVEWLWCERSEFLKIDDPDNQELYEYTKRIADVIFDKIINKVKELSNDQNRKTCDES